MTHTQRTAQRKRKERNQRIWWYIQDSLALVALLGTGYALLLIGYGLGI